MDVISASTARELLQEALQSLFSGYPNYKFDCIDSYFYCKPSSQRGLILGFVSRARFPHLPERSREVLTEAPAITQGRRPKLFSQVSTQ